MAHGPCQNIRRRLDHHIYPEDFERSPTRLDEFNQYLEVLQSGSWDKWFSGGEDEAHEDGDVPTQAPILDLSLDGCYEWATRSFFSMLEEIIPRSCKIETITLQHFFSGESFKANLKAVDDVLIPGSIQAIDETYSETGTLWKTRFPIFQARAVEVLSGSDETR